MADDAQERFQAKLDAFAASLDAEETELFTTLLAFAYLGTQAVTDVSDVDEPDDGDDDREVVGFDMRAVQRGLDGLGGVSIDMFDHQDVLDRRSKTVDLLGNLMRKVSDTSQSITANMK
jgi:hypothetical protein